MEQAIKQFRGDFFFLSNFYECPVTVTQRAWQRGRFSSGGVLSPSLKPSGEQVQGRALPPRESHVYL